MNRTIIIIISIFFLWCPAHATQEYILVPDKVIISYGSQDDPDRITLRVLADRNDTNRKIIEIELFIDNSLMKVPPSVYSDLENPQMQTIQIRGDTDYTGKQITYICFDIAFKTSKNDWCRKKVRIPYSDGKFGQRTISKSSCK